MRAEAHLNMHKIVGFDFEPENSARTHRCTHAHMLKPPHKVVRVQVKRERRRPFEDEKLAEFRLALAKLKRKHAAGQTPQSPRRGASKVRWRMQVRLCAGERARRETERDRDR